MNKEEKQQIRDAEQELIDAQIADEIELQHNSNYEYIYTLHGR